MSKIASNETLTEDTSGKKTENVQNLFQRRRKKNRKKERR